MSEWHRFPPGCEVFPQTPIVAAPADWTPEAPEALRDIGQDGQAPRAGDR